MDQWMNKRYSHALDELRWDPAPAKFFNSKISVVRDNAKAFECDFEDHVVRAVQVAIEMLLDTENFKIWTRTRECSLSNAEEEDIAIEDCVWAPRYIIKFRNFGEAQEARLIGHVEFLAGQPGALSGASRLRQTAKWCSLRCVLGDIVQWMLMNNHRYSFVVSSDEIMFLRMDVKKVMYEDMRRDLKPRTVLHEPRLHYSQPMKITDAFDAGKRTITARMGLFHLFWLVIQNDQMWHLPDEMGNCLNYATFTKDNEDLNMKRPCAPQPFR